MDLIINEICNIQSDFALGVWVSITTGFSARSKSPCFFFCLAGVQTGSICGGPIKVEKENQDVA